MVSRIVIVILGFVAILTFCQYEPVSALQIEIVPETVNEMITNHASITCLANDSSYWTQKIMTISIGKSGQRPIATLGSGHQIQYGADMKSNLQADGLIYKNASSSYLRLTITKPGLGDAGEYNCQMYYLDGYGQLKGGKAYANMTVDNEDDKSVLLYLLKWVADLEKGGKQKNSKMKDKIVNEQDTCCTKAVLDLKKSDAQRSKSLQQLAVAFDNLNRKFSNLEKTSTEQVNKLKDQENKQKQQETAISDKGKQLKAQENRIDELHANDASNKAAFNNLVKKVSDLEKTSTQQDNKLKDNENKLKQKEKLIKDLEKRIKEQENRINTLEG